VLRYANVFFSPQISLDDHAKILTTLKIIEFRLTIKRGYDNHINT